MRYLSKTPMPNCRQCNTGFEIMREDRTFYQKMDVPEPTLCPRCRQQRRHLFRNNFTFYHRPCDRCKKSVVSVYSPNKKDRVVYCQECWWSDEWDALDYGRDFDFSRTFTEQFADLLKVIPQVALINTGCKNCEYSHFSGDNKDSYLLIQSSNNERCHYSFWMQVCNDCVDGSILNQCEFCYESIYLDHCYRCFYCHNLDNCSECLFSIDLIGCKNCFGCAGLRQKEYCIFNEQKTKAEYEAFIGSLKLGAYSGFLAAKKQAEDFLIKQPRRAAEMVQAENSFGNYLKRVKNCYATFICTDVEDCRYGERYWRDVRDCMDVTVAVRGVEKCYESVQSVIGVHNCRFIAFCRLNCSDLTYCHFCVSSQNCFGSASLNKQKYCILNKQYSKADYEALVPRIIEHMKKTGEWGEFFHPSLSSFGYNETDGHSFYPLKKAEALAKGYFWEDQTPGIYGQETLKPEAIPDDIKALKDEITKEVLKCTGCGKNYRLIIQELTFYREHNIPIPRRCFDCRREARMKWSNPFRFWKRACAKCGTNMMTTYAPDRPEIVYCEDCYLKEVY